MNQKIIVTLMEKELQRRMGKGYEFKLQDIWKFNDIGYTGMTVNKEGCHVSPVYNFGRYAERITAGERIETVVDEIITDFEGSQRELREDYGLFDDFSRIEKRIRFKFCKKEWNTHYIKDKAYRDFLDFAVLYYLDVRDLFPGQDGYAEIMITEDYLAQWGVSEEEVFQAAFSNLSGGDLFQVFPMDGLLNKLTGKEMEEMPDSIEMYILTDWSGENYGASAFFAPKFLKKAAVLAEGSYYILPSSISELIVVPERTAPLAEELGSIVREVNQSCVKRKEQLSDQVYHYDAATGHVNIAK